MAALLVFGYHLARWDVLRLPGFTIGYVGVAFFFVLSGLLLTWGYGEHLSPSQFYWKRLVRIWPNHLATLVVALIVPVTAFPLSSAAIWPNLALLQAWIPSMPVVYGMNGVSWSLSCEVMFYLAFPLILRVTRSWSLPQLAALTGITFSIASTLVLIVSTSAQPGTLGLIVYTNPLVRLPEFLIGILAAKALKRGWRPNVRISALTVAVATIGVTMMHGGAAPDVWAVLLFTLILVWAARWDITGKNLFATRPLQYAGRVSFAFYLVHELVILNIRSILGPGPTTAAVALGVAAAAAAALYHLIEIPAQKLFALLRSLPRKSRNESLAR